MVAMQVANDNADNLIEELTREYNKLRQESITNELLDLIGGSLGKY
jgi:F-type H+-transporting ATPase subunit gamma